MNYIQKITKIRERGQMTVPYDIRKALDWPSNEFVVRVETIENGFKVESLISSHSHYPKKKLDKKEAMKLWGEMKRISKLGRKVNLTRYLRKDRDTHF